MIRQLTFSLLFLFAVRSIFSADDTCTKTNCVLPGCQCPVSNGNPTLLNTTDLPQLVLLTFVGNLNRQTFDSVRSILNPAHRNPNRCPISSTFFVNDNYTEYCLAQRLFDNQNEIAMTTSSNKCPLTNCYEENYWRQWTDKDWQREIKQQRLNIYEHAHIHRSHIKGFRVPHLQIDQNHHLEYIRNFHFHYDSSMLFAPTNFIWPFTLNHPFNQTDCTNCDEFKAVQGLWQVPLHEWTYVNATKSCRTLSDASCLPDDKPHTADLLFDLIKYNFERHASLTLGHRSPFVIELDLFWLAEEKATRLEALIHFIEYILNSPEHRHVYFVSIEQALEWMQYPRAHKELQDFWAFGCSDTVYEYDIDCSDAESDGKKKADAQSLLSNGTNQTDSEPQDRQAEDLFRSGIVFHSVWLFVVLSIAVFVYDRYFASK